jgi:putative hydrolase of HD superfamily
MADLPQLIDFVRFTQDFRHIQRALYAVGDDRPENDAEHSYQLALVGWYVNEINGLGLDSARIISLALVHDLVEVFAGDTAVYGSANHKRTQRDREKKAVAQIQKAWPSFKVLHTFIEEYEECQTSESQLVYALDKLLPIVNNYLDGGRSWKEDGVSLRELKSVKAGKVDISPIVEKYYNQLLIVLEKNRHLFGRPENLIQGLGK